MLKKLLVAITLLSLMVSPALAQETQTPEPKRITNMLWSPDGHILAAQTSMGIYLYQAKIAYEIGSDAPSLLEATEWGQIVFSPDSQWLFYSLRDIQVFESHTGKMVTRIPASPDGDKIVFLSFNPSGTVGVTNTVGESCTCDIDLWDIRQLPQNLQHLVTLKATQVSSFGIRESVFSPDETQLASIDSDGVVRLWDIKTGEQTALMRGFQAYVGAMVKFSPDGKRLVSMTTWPGNDGLPNGNSFLVWDLDRLRPEQSVADPEKPDALISQYTYGGSGGFAISHDSSTLAIDSGDGYIQLNNIQTGEPITRVRSGSVTDLNFSKDDSHFFAIDRKQNIWIWDAEMAINYGMDRQALPVMIAKTEAEAQQYIPELRFSASLPEPETIGLEGFEWWRSR